MPAAPTRLLITIFAVAALALLALVIAVTRAPVLMDSDRVLLTALLVGLLLLARLHPVQLEPKTKTMVDTAPLFAAALLLPPPVAMALAATSAATVDAVRRVPWFQALFNTSEATLRVAVAATVLGLLGDTHSLADGAVAPWLVTIPLAAILMYLVNNVLVDLVVGVQLRRFPFQNCWRRWQFSFPQEAALFLLGVLVAAVGAQNPWAIALLVMPSIVVHRSLRDGVALKVQTREALEELADIVDMRDHYTYEHSRRVAAVARATAESLGLPADEMTLIEMAGRVHDVGKIGIKSTVLMKPVTLTETEWREMRSHPEIGAKLVAKFPQFARGRDLILSHHERYDGTGYPRRLAGSRIPLGARVLAVADAWDAMTSHRAYRQALAPEQVGAELERGRGTQFDPVVLDAFLAVLASRPDLAAYHTHERQDVDVLLPQPTLA